MSCTEYSFTAFVEPHSPLSILTSWTASVMIFGNGWFVLRAATMPRRHARRSRVSSGARYSATPMRCGGMVSSAFVDSGPHAGRLPSSCITSHCKPGVQLHRIQRCGSRVFSVGFAEVVQDDDTPGGMGLAPGKRMVERFRVAEAGAVDDDDARLNPVQARPAE